MTNITSVTWPFEIKCLRQVLKAKRTNEWYCWGVKKSTCICERKQHGILWAYEKGNCLENEIIQGTTPSSRTRDRHKMTGMDNKIVVWVITERTSKECGKHTSMEKGCSWCKQPLQLGQLKPGRHTRLPYLNPKNVGTASPTSHSTVFTQYFTWDL